MVSRFQNSVGPVDEQWKLCVDDYYEISNFGRLRRAKPGHATWVGRLRKINRDRNGYLACGVTTTKSFRVRISNLVAEAFIGPRPNGMDINHKDLNKENNCWKNLEYITHKENQRHAVKNGRQMGVRGILNHNAKLSYGDVLKIRDLHTTGNYSYKDLGKMFGVTQTQVGRIIRLERRCYA